MHIPLTRPAGYNSPARTFVEAGEERRATQPNMVDRSPKPLKGKELNSGIRGGLWDEKHYLKMGDAIWLFGWLVHRQTTQRNGRGLVLRGMTITYAMIANDTGFRERTLQRWMSLLVKQGYIEVRYSVYKRMVIRILNAKKFTDKQLSMLSPNPPKLADNDTPKVADNTPPNPPDVAESYPPMVADSTTKSGGFKRDLRFEQKLPVNGNNSDARSARVLSPHNGDESAESADTLSKLSDRELKGLRTTLLRSVRDRRLPEAFRVQIRGRLKEVEQKLQGQIA